ncbi:MAG: hypothetical protein ABIP49_02755 [Lysobacterales bacterium]
MTGQTRKYLSATLCLFLAAQTAAEAPAQSDVVPVEQEPRHRLALEDQYIRLFDVRVPPGDTTLYHTHQRDSIYIPISGTANLVTQELGKAAKPLSIKPGDVAFAEHSKASFTHRVSNLGTDEFHVIDIELIATLKPTSVVGELPWGHQSILENPQVRVSRIVLAPGQFVVGDSSPARKGITVVLAGTRIGIRRDPGATQRSDVVLGQIYRRAELMSQEIHNEGSDRLELISVEIK